MFDLSADQELLQETTRRFLEANAPPAQIRALAGTKAGFEPSYWRQGARLGWASLVVPEEAGGGSVSGLGVIDLCLVAYEFGLHAAPGPLGPVNLIAAALGRWGSPGQRSAWLGPLMEGEQIGAWALAERSPEGSLGRVSTRASAEGDEVVITGTKAPVEAGAEAACLLVVARDGGGLSQYLVPADAPGLTVTPLKGLDMTRRYARVDLEAVRVPGEALVGARGGAAAAVDWLSDLATVIQLAETVGCMSWALDATLSWASNRYSFGRPLASYQEIKHRFADMKTWLEASAAIVGEAASAVEGDSRDRASLVSAAKLYVGRNSTEMLQDCVQLHGGIGVTFDHDLHLFLRRVATNRPLYGTPEEHACRLGRILVSQELGHRGDAPPGKESR